MSVKGIPGQGGSQFPQSPTAQKKAVLKDMSKSMEQQRRDMGMAPSTFALWWHHLRIHQKTAHDVCQFWDNELMAK
jgi:hypothetical protein